MQINLKQPEIEAALKLYITQQGINLQGKTVMIEFTSGRKNNGLSAEVSIEDSAVPGYTDTFVMHAVPTPVVAPVKEEVPEPLPEVKAEEPEPTPDVPPEDTPTPPHKPVISLFS